MDDQPERACEPPVTAGAARTAFVGHEPSRAARAHDALAHVLHPVHLRRTVTIALVVGTFLTLANQGDVLLAGHLTAGTALKILTTYVTPFVVSNLGLLSGRPGPDRPGLREGPPPACAP
jgi:hypothetical protein